ncbi:Raftlin [Oryzias melastigma]|uniref:Raftlin n=1 Tax=Oryzias melastigma TaxID=30732 RepID=A0A834CCM2_ORYME|nr:Raftlin [Oryzias melastigma]
MGCGLRKIKPPSEENSPGKIYSTLRRPQVETKVGVAYTYRYLDFLIGKDGGTSTLRLSSVRELPAQLQELYQQGFVLAAVHPFIHPCGPESSSPQHHLYRAILVRLSDGVERSPAVCPQFKLQLEECLSAEQVPTPELIQGYVKKIQDAADQGVMFVGFIQEPRGALCARIREPETPSLSLHSSPSSVLGSLGSCSPSNPSSPNHHPESDAPEKWGNEKDRSESKTCEHTSHREAGVIGDGVSSAASPSSEEDLDRSEELTEEDSLLHNGNKDSRADAKERPRYRLRRGDGVDLLALFNHPPVREGQLKYYTVKVPLRVQNCKEGVRGVEANWLDHMTQHFNNGASLVDGYFHLSSDDLLSKSVESVFVFQEASEEDPNVATPTYDAIVVEQWTIIDGLQVKADYVPLLQSLATYGWRLTCVLPTPVIKTNSDGSLSTKQIVFLQRPVLSRKRKESKKLIFKPRSKSNKNFSKDSAKNKKKPKGEKDAEDPKICNDRGTTENKNEAETENAAEVDDGSQTHRGTEDSEESRETEGRKENEEAEKEVPMALEGEELRENGEVEETVATVEKQSETKEEETVMENGIETEEEEKESREIESRKGEHVEAELKVEGVAEQQA